MIWFRGHIKVVIINGGMFNMAGKMKIKFIFFALLLALILLFIYFAGQPCVVKFSKDFYYDYESNSIFGKDDLVDVAPKIIDYDYDKNFVAVKQSPKYSHDSMYDYPEDFSSESYKNGLNDVYYWVISLKDKKVYGPMLFEDYNKLCKEIGSQFFVNLTASKSE